MIRKHISKVLNLANLITVLRVAMIFIAAGLLYTESLNAKIVSFFMIIIIILLDWIDGVVARALHEVTKAGSIFDIVGDRIVENVMWIVFADLDLVPVWVPLAIITRGLITDSIRALAFKKGKTPFGMMHAGLGHFLTSSRFMRAFYGTLKAVVFAWLVFASNLAEFLMSHGFETYISIVPFFTKAADVLVMFTVAICIIRGIPVIVEGKKLIVMEG